MKQPIIRAKTGRPYNQLSLNKFHQISKAGKGKTNQSGLQLIKKQIRDLKRLIAHGKMPEEVLKTKQQELVDKEAQLGASQQQKKKDDKKVSYFSQKYDNIKKIELKKIARKLRQVNKTLEGDGDISGKPELVDQKNDLLTKIKYVKTYPKDQKYISVLKDNEDHASTKKKELLDKINQRTEQFRSKKFALQPTEPTLSKKQLKKETANDDFFTADQQADNVVKKKLVNKQGQIIN